MREALVDLRRRDPDFNLIFAMACLAEASLVLCDGEAASAAHDLLEPYRHHHVSTGSSVLPSVDHYLGRLDSLLGRHTDAERSFEQALVIAARMESPMLAAYTNAAWAAMLAERGDDGDRDRAVSLAGAALATAERLGLGYVGADAQKVILSLRA